MLWLKIGLVRKTFGFALGTHFNQGPSSSCHINEQFYPGALLNYPISFVWVALAAISSFKANHDKSLTGQWHSDALLRNRLYSGAEQETWSGCDPSYNIHFKVTNLLTHGN